MPITRTLEDWMNSYLEQVRSLYGSPFTVSTLRDNGRIFLHWLEATHDVRTTDALRLDHLYAWQKHLAVRRTGKGLPLKPRSVNKLVECTRTFLKYLIVQGMVPAALLKAIAYVKVPRLLPTCVLNHSQVKKLLSRIDTSTPEGFRDRVLIELLYSSGLRARELLGLNVPDVDFTHATALVTGKGVIRAELLF